MPPTHPVGIVTGMEQEESSPMMVELSNFTFLRFPTGSPAEEVSGGDPEDLEENGNEGGADLPDLAEPAVGAHHQPRSLHGGQVVL